MSKKTIQSITTSGLGLILVLFALGQFQRFQLGQTTAIYLHDLVISGWLLVSFFWLATQKGLKQLLQPSILRWQLAFVLWAGVTLLLADFILSLGSSFAWLYYLRYLVLSLLPLGLYGLLAHKLITWDVQKFMIYAGLWALLFGLVQYLLVPDVRFLYYFGWDDHLNRLIGSYFDPGFTGLVFVLVYCLWQFRQSVRRQLDSLVSAAIMVGIGLTYSRASFLALAVVLLVMMMRHGFLRYGQHLLAFAVIVLMLPQQAGEGVRLERTYSVATRAESSLTAGQVFQENLVFGVGLNNYREFIDLKPYDKPHHVSAPDNSYVFVLATTGMIGGVLFLGYLWSLLKFGYLSSPVLFTSTLAISTHAWFNNSWFYVFVLIWMGMLVGSELSKQTTR